MTRNYGSVGRRSGGAGWQWLIIGAVLGFACAAVLGFVGVIAGVFNVTGTNLAFGASPTPVVITATLMPATATPIPTEVVVTATPTVGVQSQFQAPSATPTTDLTLLAPSASPTSFPTPNLGGATTGSNSGAGASSAQTVGDGQPDPVLLDLVQPSELVDIPGAAGQEFQMGTTAVEVSAAVDLCIELGGRCTLQMGEDSDPPHPVTLSPFRMELTEVSYRQYLAFLNYNEQTQGPRFHTDGCFGQPCISTNIESDTSSVSFATNYSVLPVIENLPITEVTWWGARAYCEAIGRRLPTEAEWERAARSGDGRIYPWGNDWDPTLASTNRTADGSAPAKVDVNQFPLGTSPYGILNMAGNVAEWVFDWYDANYYNRADATGPNPQGPASGTTKVARGGSWDNPPFFARSVHRQDFAPTDATPFIGFRCAGDAVTNPNAAAQTGGALLPGAINTPDPATLGLPTPIGAGANAAPTLPAPPTSAIPTATPAAVLPSPLPVTPTTTGPTATLDPGA